MYKRTTIFFQLSIIPANRQEAFSKDGTGCYTAAAVVVIVFRVTSQCRNAANPFVGEHRCLCFLHRFVHGIKFRFQSSGLEDKSSRISTISPVPQKLFLSSPNASTSNTRADYIDEMKQTPVCCCQAPSPNSSSLNPSEVFNNCVARVYLFNNTQKIITNN